MVSESAHKIEKVYEQVVNESQADVQFLTRFTNKMKSKSNNLKENVKKKTNEQLNKVNLSMKQPKQVKEPKQAAKITNLDGVLENVGSFGLYQKLQFLLVSFLAILPGMLAFSYVFVSATPKFTCSLVKETVLLNTASANNFLAKFKVDKNLRDPFKYISIEDAESLIETTRFIRLVSKENIRNKKSEINFDNECRLEKSKLFRFVVNNTRLAQNETTKTNSTILTLSRLEKLSASSFECVQWVYDESMYGQTTVSDWDLVCWDAHLKALTQNTFILGTGCSAFTGIISDKLGRRNALILMITILILVLNSTQFFMHSGYFSDRTKFIIFTFSRFFQGLGSTLYSVAFVLLVEITGPKHRVIAGNILAYSFAVGQITLVCFSYYFQNWLKISWFVSLYCIPFFAYYWLVPESPRWLLSANKIQQARSVIEKISRVNNSYEKFCTRFLEFIPSKYSKKKQQQNQAKTQQESEEQELNDPNNPFAEDVKNENNNKITPNSWVHMFTLLQQESNKFATARKNTSYKKTIKEILGSSILVKRCLILFYIWMVILAVYLGIGMGISGNLDKSFNPYIVFLIAAICEFLSIVTCHIVLNRFGRKYPLICFLVLCSIVIYLIPVFYETQPFMTMVVYFIAKYAIGGAQLSCMIFTSELYPTPIRSTGVGLSIAIARLGGVWAPQINVLSFTFDSIFVPFVIFSVNALFAAILCSFLPETLNKKLPENVSQAIALNNDKTGK
jgi:MFS family permease